MRASDSSIPSLVLTTISSRMFLLYGKDIWNATKKLCYTLFRCFNASEIVPSSR